MRARLTLLAALVATPAAAHSPLPGVEGFYAGLLHPLTTPDQVLALLATGLLLGTYGMARLVPAVWALGAGLVAGLAFGSAYGDPAPALYGFAALAGTFAALAPGRALMLAFVATGAAGVLLGAAAIPDAGPARDRIITMAGSFAGVALLTLWVAGGIDLLRSRIRHPLIAVALRIAGAWIAAIATMMLALAQRS